MYIYNKDKNFSNTMSAVSDLVNLTKATTQAILKEVQVSKSAKDAEKILQKVFQDQRIQSISKTASKIATKVGIPLIIITGTYEAVKLFVNEDYDASVVSTIKTALGLYLLISASFIYLLILEVIWAYFSHYVIDSSIEKYLVKSLLYQDIPFLEISYKNKSIWGKSYEASFLLETTNQNKKLKAISSDGFNSPKKLVSFIGENYKGNEKYFDTSLRNELSFFKSSLFGYKLELLNDTKRVKKLRNKYDVDVVLYEKTFVKIPSIIVEDKSSKFIFVWDEKIENKEKYVKKYNIIDKSTIPKEDSYYIYNLYNQNFSQLDELKTIDHKKASVIVLSSQVELKYDFIYDYKDLNYLFALNFEQSSFTPQDIDELDKLIEKKEETK